jgi:protein disulfide-isomerase A6
MKYNKKSPTLMLFHADWCGHCQNFMPNFDKFSNNINKSKLNILKFNADTDQNTIKSFNINGFPTVLLHDPNSKRFIQYTGDRSITDLVKFVSDNTGVNVIN